MSVLVLCYHDISPAPCNEWVVTPTTFHEHIALLLYKGYQFVTLDDLLSSTYLHGRSVVAVTFDDGRLGAYTYGRAILDSFGQVATYYVCPTFIDGTGVPTHERYSRFMTWGHIAELMKSGSVIGSHGLRHRPLFTMSRTELLIELKDGKRQIESQLGAQCIHFAAAYGELDGVVSGKCADCGYRTAVSTVYGVNRSPYDLYSLKRVVLRSFDSAATLKWMIDKENGLMDVPR